jgi:polysaccharide biosynthesis protein PslG
MDALRLILCGALSVLALLAAPAAAGARQVPRGFIGTTMSGPLLDPEFDAAAETRLMARSGIEAVRVPIYWRVAQPDAAGEPIDFGPSDSTVALAAARRFSILPVILQSPRWAAKDPSLLWSPPADPKAYARFAAALVGRYGPAGSFWDEHPELPRIPVRAWQIWNEPGQEYFWAPKPAPKDYVALLRAARAAIKAVDPGAKIVMAGLNERAWKAIVRFYKAGAARLFDVAAVHPFTLEVGNVLRIVRLVRRAMKRHGDARKPLLVSELSWPTAPRRIFGFEVTEAEQASKARAALRRLAADRKRDRLAGVYWETWISPDSDPTYSFDWAGLRALSPSGPRSKPALATFARTARRLEGRR